MPVPFRATPSRLALPGAAALFIATLLAACSKPAAPDTERPPEPQAANAGLREAIQAPIDRARQADADVQDAAEAQRAAIEAAGG